MRCLAELADEIREIVGNGLTERIVVNRAKRTPEVTGTLFARLTF